MSTAVFPTLPGLAFPWKRSPIFKTRRNENVSGKETRSKLWSYPRYLWELDFAALRQGNLVGTWAEYDTLRGFFESMSGGGSSFLFEDPDDKSVTGQTLTYTVSGITAYQLVRTKAGATCPILSPNLTQTITIYLNGTVVNPTLYSVTGWETSNANGPGCIIFTSAPTSAQLLTADFSYYWPVRFEDDQITFEKFLSNCYSAKSISFKSIK